jgi:hypothetical protein
VALNKRINWQSKNRTHHSTCKSKLPSFIKSIASFVKISAIETIKSSKIKSFLCLAAKISTHTRMNQTQRISNQKGSSLTNRTAQGKAPKVVEALVFAFVEGHDFVFNSIEQNDS